MASSQGFAEVILLPLGDVPDSIGSRDILLTKDQPVITVGRSSRNKNKNLLPEIDNAYFDSPVMSRLHAWIKCDEEGKVVIADAQSMHGTFLNDKPLEPKVFVPLESGATVRFGNAVVRGSETFPAKRFTARVIKHSRMTPITHGYGITSDELVLPDYSDDDSDDIMITKVNELRSAADYQDEEPPSEIPTSAIRESLDKDAGSDDFEVPPTVTTTIDLTVDTQNSIKNRNSSSRISIAELLAQERREQSRQSSRTPAREGTSATNPLFLDSDQEDEDAEYEPEEIDEEFDDSEQESNSESVPTSPISENSAKSSTGSLPLPDIQAANSISNAPITPLNRVPAFDDLPVSPEVKQAWTSTWGAPLLSRFPFTPGQDSSSSSPETMEQVRKAEAMRDRAQEFWRSRTEMQGSTSFVTPVKEKQAENPYPTPASAPQNSTNSAPVVPLWVRNFVQGNYFGAKQASEAESLPFKPTSAKPPSQSRGQREVEEEVSDKLADAPSITEDKQIFDTEGQKAATRDVSSIPEEVDMSDINSEDCDHESHDSCFDELEMKFYDDEIPEDAYCDDETESHVSGYGEELDAMFLDGEFDDDDDEDEDYDEDNYHEEDEEDEGILHEDSDSEEEDDEDDEAPLITLMNFQTPKQPVIVTNAVKNAMSMENFFSPVDEPVYSSQAEWDKVNAGPSNIPQVELVSVSVSKDRDVSPPAKKRKREASEEADCRTTTEMEVDITTRKIAALPRRRVPTMEVENSVPTDVLPIGSPAELEVETKSSSIEEEPAQKKAKTENARGGWGTTFATALAGAVVGGVGVFAALVATAGEL